eukprot:9493106-Karenia_brevis.AAC.1
MDAESQPAVGDPYQDVDANGSLTHAPTSGNADGALPRRIIGKRNVPLVRTAALFRKARKVTKKS